MSSLNSLHKPRLSFWQIWNMSFGFLGIQFGFALQNANTSRIFETLGADTANLALYWLAAPITGLIVQPIIGFYSDRTWHPKWGRRRPYFAIGAILASIALCLMPNSSALWMAVGVLWIMDASINISMEPFRAFVGDMLSPAQRTAGFAMQSFFIGTGAVVASSLPYIFRNWFGFNDSQALLFSFYTGAIALFVTVLWTVFSTKEYPPSEEQSESLRNRVKRKLENEEKHKKIFIRVGVFLLILGTILAFFVQYFAIEKELYILSFGFGLFGAVFLLAASYVSLNKSYLGIVHMAKDFLTMPKTMVQLAYVQFFSWFALFSMWIFTTPVTTSYLYDIEINSAQINDMHKYALTIDPPAYEELKSSKSKVLEDINQLKSKLKSDSVPANISLVELFLKLNLKKGLEPELAKRLSVISSEYNKGANWVGILFAIYNGTAAIIAWLLPIMAKYTSRRATHLIALCCGGLGLASFYFIHEPDLLIFSMIGVGIAWASILSIPYAMLSGSLPAEKMGYYMGVFNFFIVIPQILAGTVLGFLLTKIFQGESVYILVTGGISMVVAGLLSLRVDDRDEVIIKEKG